MIPLCDIVIPIWNQPEMTARCLESVAACTREPVRLILVDNGSDAPTRELLDRFKAEGKIPTEILRNDTNLGFIKAVNRGIRAGKAPWVCLLNNDTVVTSGWLSEMIHVAESDPGIGLVNPSSNTLGSDPQKRSPGWVELPVAIGFCLLARRSLFDRIGLLDEQFGMGNFDDDDLSLRIRKAGLKPVRALAAYVHHEEKSSFKKLPGWEKAFDENRRRFEKKWGRRLRILWARPAGQASAELANEGHWICVVPTGDKGWRARALWKLLAKRKKPFNLVISPDPSWIRWVKRFGWLHRAMLLTQPDEKEIVARCRELSLSR